jgi:hypothetical protein
MLTELATIKTRLGLEQFNVQFDELLANAIAAISARFDRECNRTLARGVDALHEFDAHRLEIAVATYPIESVTKFEVKANETSGWIDQAGVEYLVRGGCIISLAQPLGTPGEQGRITYTGGFVLPGTDALAGQTRLPADLEQAAVEQVAYWFQVRDKLGLIRIWPHQSTYEQFMQIELLPSVSATLKQHTRSSI